MPKRAPTPPPGDDEPKYLTVMYPYPAHANLEADQDRAECARWLACCIGKEMLYAMFHKPTSPNAVIIEVDRDFGRWEALLGEHRWSEVFKNCEPVMKDRVSQIFWCHFSTGRQVQKYGWKRVDVLDKWFRGWYTPNKIVTHPYPKTHWCEVPKEDKTNAPLCRPLPVATFPPPQPSLRPPPVGSAEWLSAKQSIAPSAKSVWGKGTPALSFAAASLAQESTAASSTGGRASIGVPVNGSLSRPQGPPPGLPPLDTPYSPGSESAWEVPDLTRGNSASSGKRPGSDDGDEDEDEIIGMTPAPSVAPSVFVAGEDFEQTMAALSVAGNDFDDFDDAMLPTAAATLDHQAPVEPEDNLWADYEDEPARPQASDVIICPAHGALCPRGICKDYLRIKKGRERAIEDEKKAQAILEKKRQKKSKSKGTAPEPEQKISYSVPRVRPAHLKKVVPTPDSLSSIDAEEKVVTPVREKPAHLMKGAAAAGGGRRMNSNPIVPPVAKTPVSPNGDGAKSAAATSAGGWGHVPRDPWGNNSIGSSDASKGPAPAPSNAWAKGSVNGDDARSVAASSASGWGAVPRGPWGTSSMGGLESGKKPPSATFHAWAKESVNNDDSGSVASSASGWGRVPGDPWGGKSRASSKAGSDAGTIRAGPRGVKKSWADQMEDEESRSVATSSSSGWGRVSNGPW